jgi:uncharacterized protein (TIGR00251 family)
VPKDAALIALRVIPNASRDEISSRLGEAVKVKVQAPAEGGRANRSVIRLLANAARLPRRTITIVSGEKGRDKRLEISGLSKADFMQRIYEQ